MSNDEFIAANLHQAAKALGWAEGDGIHYFFNKGKDVGTIAIADWRPRQNSAQALNMAADLKISIKTVGRDVYAQHRTPDGFWINSPNISMTGRLIPDVYREAICICAIKVGERMP